MAWRVVRTARTHPLAHLEERVDLLLASELVGAENSGAADAVGLDIRISSDAEDAALPCIQSTLAHDALTFDR